MIIFVGLLFFLLVNTEKHSNMVSVVTALVLLVFELQAAAQL